MIRSRISLTVLFLGAALSAAAQTNTGSPYEPETTLLLLEAPIAYANFLAANPNVIPLPAAVIPAIQDGSAEVRARLSNYSAANRTALVSYFLVPQRSILPSDSDPNPKAPTTIAQFTIRVDSIQFVTATQLLLMGRMTGILGGTVTQDPYISFTNGSIVVISFSGVLNFPGAFQDIMFTFPGLISTWAPAGSGNWAMNAPSIPPVITFARKLL